MPLYAIELMKYRSINHTPTAKQFVCSCVLRRSDLAAKRASQILSIDYLNSLEASLYVHLEL